jgi:hypothetical protein
MPDSIRFYPECHVDTALMRTLLQDRQQLIVHIKGAPKVGDALHEQAERYGDSRVVVGMVDNDKQLFSITKLKPFNRVVARCEEASSPFVVYQHETLATQYLVVIGPKACDGWIYGAAKAAGLDPATYSLPPTLPEFLAFTKKTQAEERPEIVGLLKALRRLAPPAYQQLAEFISARLQEAGAESSW